MPLASGLAPSMLAALALVLCLAPDARAAGGFTPPKDKAATCEDGEVYSEREKKCVAEDSAALTEGDRYEAGRALAHAGRHDAAIRVLERADAADARVRNYLGFAHRKAGRLDEALDHYRAALRLDPGLTLARSYMGQALLAAGDAAGAREQLRLIRAATGPVSLEYVMLRDALGGAGTGY